MVSASESSKFFALFSEKVSLFDESVASNDVEKCRSLIQESQALVSAHSFVLPPRDLQTYKGRIEEFKKTLDKIKEPKKRFGFSKTTKDAHETRVRSEKPTEALPEAAMVDPKTAAFTINNLRGETVELSDVHGEVELRNLSGCTVRVRGTPATLYITEVHECKVICDPIASSVLIVGFDGSELLVACQQLRIHKAKDSVFRLHITSRSIIEDCTNLTFASLPSDYPAPEANWEAAGLLNTKNNYNLVDDFNWLNVNEPSPNWRLSD